MPNKYNGTTQQVCPLEQNFILITNLCVTHKNVFINTMAQQNVFLLVRVSTALCNLRYQDLLQEDA